MKKNKNKRSILLKNGIRELFIKNEDDLINKENAKFYYINGMKTRYLIKSGKT
jgi:hypothetical protein